MLSVLFKAVLIDFHEIFQTEQEPNSFYGEFNGKIAAKISTTINFKFTKNSP
jgi:hypothetical protein